MHDRSHLHAGLVGAVVAAVCCLVPILLVATGVIGVGALTTAIYGLFCRCRGVPPMGTPATRRYQKTLKENPYVRLLRAQEQWAL